MTDHNDMHESPRNEPALGPDVLTKEQVAAMTGHTPETIREYRSQRNRHRGPPFHRNGKHVYYLRPEVEAWIEKTLAKRRGLLK